MPLVDENCVIPEAAGGQFLQRFLNDQIIETSVLFLKRIILSGDAVAKLKEMTGLDPILPEGDMLVGQETADVIDEGDVVTDEKNVPDALIVLL